MDISAITSNDGHGVAAPAPGHSGTVLGLDIGGTKLAAGVVEPNGEVRSFLVTPSRPEEGARVTLNRLFDLGNDAVAQAGAPRLTGIGIGCGGPLDPYRGILLRPPHLPDWVDVPIVEWTQDFFGVPAVLDNDATAAAAGEHRFGAGVGTRHMVYLTLSTGVGGGIVIDGKVYRGAAGNGGELGHITVDQYGRFCRSCGRRGCLEAYVSGGSIAERARETLASGDAASSLTEVPQLTAADVHRAALAGDPVATIVWDETVEALGCGLTSIVNLIEPELVVLGGGVTLAGEHLIGPARQAVTRRAMAPAARAVRIVRAALGDRVGVVGAATIGYERLPIGRTPPDG